MRLNRLALVASFPLLIAAEENGATVSPIQQRIQAAQKETLTNPQSWQSYNELAFALCRAARDREDVALYDDAEAALRHSFQLSKDNYGARKLEASILLGKHEFADALKLARELNRKVPDDIAGWGLLVDVNVALGDYDQAERAAQWILDLTRGSSLGFLKAAELRELFGDFQGSIEFFQEAYRRSSPNDADQRAWLLTRMAEVQLLSGNLAQAQNLLSQASKLFPDSQLLRTDLAKLRAAQGKYEEAASILENRYRTVPSPVNLYAWAEALSNSGRKSEAALAFEKFEKEARAESMKPYNSNLELIYLYTDRKNEPVEALRIASARLSIRHDVNTLDAYAWALFRNGRASEAKVQMDRALGVGVSEPVFFCHAAQIALAARDMAGATRLAREASRFSSNFCPIDSVALASREAAQ